MVSKKNSNFGRALRGLRVKKGLSLKQLSSKLSVNYSYISKLENLHTKPSKEFILRVAKFFECDNEELMLQAGKIPSDILDILTNNPKKAAAFLREQFTENGHSQDREFHKNSREWAYN